MLKTLTLALLGLSLICVPAHAGPVQYQWLPSGPGEYALLANGHQIGSLRADPYGYYKLLPGDIWQEIECPVTLPAGVQEPAPCKCPCKCGCCCSGKCNCGDSCPCPCGCGKSGSCSCGCKGAIGHEPNYGVQKEKIQHGQHRINGRQVSREEIISAIKDVPKDQDKLRLTLIGDPKGSSAQELALFAKGHDLLFQAYPPDHWAIKDMGYKTDALPVVYLQQPDGKVLLRLDGFSGKTDGPLMEAVRAADPAYDPRKDPNGSPLGLDTLLTKLKSVPLEVWAGLAIVIYLLRKKGQ